MITTISVLYVYFIFSILYWVYCLSVYLEATWKLFLLVYHDFVVFDALLSIRITYLFFTFFSLPLTQEQFDFLFFNHKKKQSLF